jgi:hypothetical protein
MKVVLLLFDWGDSETLLINQVLIINSVGDSFLACLL